MVRLSCAIGVWGFGWFQRVCIVVVVGCSLEIRGSCLDIVSWQS